MTPIHDERRTITSRRMLWIGVFTVIVIVAGILTGISDAHNERIRKDFTQYSLAASRVLFDGHNPYDRNLVERNYKYFPTNAILLRPFVNMPFYVGQGIWFAINLGLLFGAFAALRSMLLPLKLPWYAYALVIAAGIRAITMNLRLGQWNTSVFCLSIIGIALLYHSRRTVGSLCLGLAITLKFMPGIFLVYFAIRRRWRDLAMTALAALFWAFLFPMIIMGPTRGIELLENFRIASMDRIPKVTAANETSSVSMYSTIYRTLTPAPIELKGINFKTNLADLAPEQAARVAGVFGVIALIVVFGWMFIATRRGHVNHVGELLLVGLTYMAWFIAAPGVRHAQLISIVPAMFAIVAAMVYAGSPRLRWRIVFGFLFVTLAYVSTSEIVDKTRYNLYLEANGIVSWSLCGFALLLTWTFNRVGRTELIPVSPVTSIKDAADTHHPA